MAVDTRHGRDHLVRLYDDENDLAAGVVPFLASGFDASGAAIVVASAERRDAFCTGLRQAGIDVEQALGWGSLILLDARSTLDELLLDGQPDAPRFEAVIGESVRSVADHGTVRAYGEMVDLLWADGDVVAAIELEGLWNDLQARQPFDLYCAYRAAAVANVDGGMSVIRNCHTHTICTATDARTCRFDPSPESPVLARRFVANALPAIDRRLFNDVMLVLGELASNAVLHAATPFSVEAASRAGVIRVSVTDQSVSMPMERTPCTDTVGGHGLRIVGALSNRWGVEAASTGKTVWAEFVV